jgi:hypothetical protein
MMLRSLLAAALVLAPVPADWTQCSIINNGPITPTTPREPFQRQPDFAALSAYPRTMIFDGMPPLRMRGPAVVVVSTGSLPECGQPIPKFVFEACVRDHIIHTANPCDFSQETYARLLCHEIAHERWGWPADHGP